MQRLAKGQFNLTSLFLGVAAAALWSLIFSMTARSPLSPIAVGTVLCAISATIYFPIRRWDNAWVVAALLAGIISVVSLLIAVLLANLG
jgi:hypothetical protein